MTQKQKIKENQVHIKKWESRLRELRDKHRSEAEEWGLDDDDNNDDEDDDDDEDGGDEEEDDGGMEERKGGEAEQVRPLFFSFLTRVAPRGGRFYKVGSFFSFDIVER